MTYRIRIPFGLAVLLTMAACESDEKKLDRLQLAEATACMRAAALDPESSRGSPRPQDMNSGGGAPNADNACLLARRELNAFMNGQ